jgi:hypothetical protein
MSTTRCSVAEREVIAVPGGRRHASVPRPARRRPATALTCALLACATGVALAAGPQVTVHDAAELQAAVADPDNAGKTIALVHGEYKLDPSGPTFGRLELQTDMELVGVPGHTDQVTIDASLLPASSFQDGMATGALRVGRGRNAVRWLTLVNAAAGAAFVETDLAPDAPGAPATVTVEHCVIENNKRGIDLRLVGPGDSGRVVEAFLRNTVIRHNTANAGQALRIVHLQGVSGGTLRATIEGCTLEGNLAGVLAAATDSSGNTIAVASRSNSYSGNGVGFLVVAGLATADRADDNSVTLDSTGDSFEGNDGPTAPYAPGTGLTVFAGYDGAPTAELANENRATIILRETRLADNPVADLVAVGAQGAGGVLAGKRNRVLVQLVETTPPAKVQQVDSDPSEPSNTSTIVTHPVHTPQARPVAGVPGTGRLQ